MGMEDDIIYDLYQAIKNKKETRHLKVIVGEMQRLPDKRLDDELVTIILRKLVNNEKERLEALNEKRSEYLDTVKGYLPLVNEASDEEVENWIRDNIDFSTLGNKFAAIKSIKAHFGARAEGAIIKKIVTEKF